MNAAQYLKLIEETDKKAVKEVLQSYSLLLEVLSKGNLEAKIPYDLYSSIYQQVWNLQVSPNEFQNLENSTIELMENFMKEK
jgi:type III secretion system FlhB-like substrate exporter